MEMVTVLKDIKTLIATPETWTTEVLARNDQDEPIDPNHPDACQWCLMGAANKICNGSMNSVLFVLRYLNSIARGKLGYPSTIAVWSINDLDGFDSVHVLLDTAIANIYSYNARIL